MNWFIGPIGNAITESQSKKLIFMVYNFDSNSKEMDELWDDEAISSLCANNCVSLRLEAESEPSNQFKQIYPISEIPTTYFIGSNGRPIERISGSVTKEILEYKIKNAINVYEASKAEVTTEAAAVIASTSTTQIEQTAAENQEDQKKKLDERVALAREKLRQIQEKKRQEEEENERKREIERRQTGKVLVKSQKEREEHELKRIAEQKKQEKLDDLLAKQKIKERIQQDREEKQQRYAKEKEEIEKAKEDARVQQELARQKQLQNEAAIKSQIARIQFKLIDGSSVVNQFDPAQTLADARAFISDKLKEMNETQSFSMHSTFPKRDYSEADMSKTLRDLQLAPSATILIIPIRSKASKAFSSLMPTSNSSNNGNVSTSNVLMTYANDFVGFLFLPFTIIWGLITSLIGIGSGTNRSTDNIPSASNRPRSSQVNQPVSDSIRIRNMRRNIGIPSSNVRSIHTPQDNESNNDNDDENNTWNGNSTQLQ